MARNLRGVRRRPMARQKQGSEQVQSGQNGGQGQPGWLPEAYEGRGMGCVGQGHPCGTGTTRCTGRHLAMWLAGRRGLEQPRSMIFIQKSPLLQRGIHSVNVCERLISACKAIFAPVT